MDRESDRRLDINPGSAESRGNAERKANQGGVHLGWRHKTQEEENKAGGDREVSTAKEIR